MHQLFVRLIRLPLEEIRCIGSQYPGSGCMHAKQVLVLVITISFDPTAANPCAYFTVLNALYNVSAVPPRTGGTASQGLLLAPATSRRRRGKVPQVQVPLPPASMTLDAPPHSSPPTVDQPSLPSTDLHCIQTSVIDIFIAIYPTSLRKQTPSPNTACQSNETSHFHLDEPIPGLHPRSATRRSRSRQPSMILAPPALVCLWPA